MYFLSILSFNILQQFIYDKFFVAVVALLSLQYFTNKDQFYSDK